MNAANWLLACALALLLAWFGPAIDDHGAEQALAGELEAAQAQARAQDRYERAVQQLCGDNAAWMQLEGGAIQCYTRRGLKTRVVTAQVQP